MKQKVYVLMLTLIAVIASLSLSSCGNDEPQVKENYYLQLVSVDTNLVNAETGQSISTALKDEFIAGSQLDSNGKFLLGKTTHESAENAFNKSISNFRESFNNAYAGQNLLPENGYLVYHFAMVKQNGSTVTSKSIRVTNEGVTIL